MILHLMTQRDQPYGSVRRCCEMCGLMMVARPESFWQHHQWTDEPELYHSHGDTHAPCTPVPTKGPKDAQG